MADLAALRVQLDLRLRAMRAGAEPSAAPEVITLAEHAVDVGSQDLILEAAAALGLVADAVADVFPAEPVFPPDAPEPPAQAPAPPPEA